MPIPETTPAPSAANEARVRASGINLTTEYGKWALNLARTSKSHLCLARKDFDFLCIQPGDGAGHRCRLHGGASRGPKTDEGRARAACNLLQNRARRAAHQPAPGAGDMPEQLAAPVPAHQSSGEFLSLEELATLTGKKRRAAQCRVLQELGIPFLLRGRTPIVSRVLVHQAMSGAAGAR